MKTRLHTAALELLEALTELAPAPDSPEGEMLAAVAAVVETYEKSMPLMARNLPREDGGQSAGRCWHCGGTGFDGDDPCPFCGGAGWEGGTPAGVAGG